MPVSQDDFKKGMQQLAATVTVITAAFDGERSGLTATAVSSVSNDPPSILICVNKTSYTHRLIKKSGTFAVNLLGSEQVNLSNSFSKKTNDPEEKFETHLWNTSIHGTPVLKDALVSFACKIDQSMDTNTHSVFIGIIEAIEVREQQPLIYGNRGYKTLTDIV